MIKAERKKNTKIQKTQKQKTTLLNLVFLVVLLQGTHSTGRHLEEHRRIVE